MKNSVIVFLRMTGVIITILCHIKFKFFFQIIYTSKEEMALTTEKLKIDQKAKARMCLAKKIEIDLLNFVKLFVK